MPEQPTPSPVAATAPPAPPEALAGEPTRPDPLAVQVAGAVQRLRREAGLSERVAARRLGTSQTQLRRMEDPRYLPSLRSLARVAAAYGYRVSVEFAPATVEKKRATAPALERTRPAAKPAPKPVPIRVSARGKAAAPRTGRSRAARKGRGTHG